mmetsp:Transcript_1091/g.2571  ORF Transcript_1091/g.2571 Transcript_1091/m.2571 type:complete len:226 (-) Transcript_1091:418-1095(-)
MTFLFLFFFKKVNSSKKRLSDGHVTYPCSKFSAVATLSSDSTSTYTAVLGLMDSLAKSWTCFVCVAEKSIVCLSFGSSFRMARKSSSNPISKIRSASSMQNTSKFRKTNPDVFRRWSSSLPGVAITMLTPRFSRSASVPRFAPPMTNPKVIVDLSLSSSLQTPYVCIANSLVGERIMAPVPFRVWNLALRSSSMMGTRNARVFPEPVCAAPIRSFPLSNGGMERA